MYYITYFINIYIYLYIYIYIYIYIYLNINLEDIEEEWELRKGVIFEKQHSVLTTKV